jgi:catechol 2,3-dioxygenase-like lactoylglutathione lyase family enzyme
VFDHVTIRASDRAASDRFYRAVLGALALEPTYAGEPLIEWDDFSIIAAEPPHGPTRALHIGFVARSRAAVDAFHRAATAAGYRSDGAPGERPRYHPGYYGAYVLDPDGTSVESVHHGR